MKIIHGIKLFGIYQIILSLGLIVLFYYLISLDYIFDFSSFEGLCDSLRYWYGAIGGLQGFLIHSLYTLILLILFASGIGLIMLRNWARIPSILILSLLAIYGIYWLVRVYELNKGHSKSGLVILVIIFIILPEIFFLTRLKVKELFK